jgi:hypothetical protein
LACQGGGKFEKRKGFFKEEERREKTVTRKKALTFHLESCVRQKVLCSRLQNSLSSFWRNAFFCWLKILFLLVWHTLVFPMKLRLSAFYDFLRNLDDKYIFTNVVIKLRYNDFHFIFLVCALISLHLSHNN